MFKNEALTDYTVPENRKNLEAALNETAAEIKQQRYLACPIIQGEELRTKSSLKSLDPSDPSHVIGDVHLASLENALSAIESVRRGAAAWNELGFEKRAAIIKAVGKNIRAQKLRFTSLVIYEAGKSWKEADADVAETIDFCEYYAAEMLRLGAPRKTEEVPGEDNFYFYQPRGVAVVISPWNFPFAIACGMTVAALVAGNGTILKPAEQTSIVAHELAKILLSSGVHKDAFACLPGLGEEIGRALVESPLVDMICFTGSRAVGLEIVAKAAVVHPGQKSIKKVMAELGGKNAIIIDEDADLDEAVRGVIYSAFGYSGQKCSACSRVLVVGDAYEPFLTRLTEAAADIIVGKPKDSPTLLGPLIDEDSQKRVLKTIELAKAKSKIAFQGNVPEKGFYVAATIFRDVNSEAPIWKEEIFGPVLCCANVDSFEKALELANASDYALTGGVYSRSPANIEKAKRIFKVGNLYINRGCTGALVCRQPFGGFKMSGVGSKAGGPDYLIQFMEPRTVSENTMRRGFAPER